jgi:mRNA-degrading endonuclease RelE of RelBE toxin-antitoxin system
VTAVYELVIAPSAEKDIRDLEWNIADAVNAKIAELAANHRIAAVKHRREAYD